MSNEDKIISALKFFGEPESKIENVDVCEDGSAYLGLTQIIEPGGLNYDFG